MIGSINPLLIIGLILAFVILFNFSLIVRYRNRKKIESNKSLTGLIDTLKSPWKDEDADLDELAKLIRPKEDNIQKKSNKER